MAFETELDPYGPLDTQATAELQPYLDFYDRIIVCMSGGKDSLACLLTLLEAGADPSKIILHHHLVDGAESDLFDWPVTEAYCRALAKAFGIPISFSWRVGGLLGEMLRDQQPTAPVCIPDSTSPCGSRTVGGEGPLGTRRKFPQQTANLKTRYCSAAIKIDVFARWLTNDKMFHHSKTLVVTGERAAESASRAKYLTFEPHRTDIRSGKKGRLVDHYRPVHKLSDVEVWQIIERWSVLPHPAYILGYGRLSCRFCVFGSKSQWASNRAIAPGHFSRIAAYEAEFGVTIHRHLNVVQMADQGVCYNMDPFWVEVANSKSFELPIFTSNWLLPQGAITGETCGPS